MRTILALYMTDILMYEDGSAAAIMHGFMAICYLTPLLGGWLADRVLGRYKTILYFSGTLRARAHHPRRMGDPNLALHCPRAPCARLGIHQAQHQHADGADVRGPEEDGTALRSVQLLLRGDQHRFLDRQHRPPVGAKLRRSSTPARRPLSGRAGAGDRATLSRRGTRVRGGAHHPGSTHGRGIHRLRHREEALPRRARDRPPPKTPGQRAAEWATLRKIAESSSSSRSSGSSTTSRPRPGSASRGTTRTSTYRRFSTTRIRSRG